MDDLGDPVDRVGVGGAQGEERRRLAEQVRQMVEPGSALARDAEALLKEKLDTPGATVVRTDGMLGIAGLEDIVKEDRPDLKFPSYQPRYPERIREHDGDCFAAIREKDIVIHHPYESFDVVVDFVRQAAG